MLYLQVPVISLLPLTEELHVQNPDPFSIPFYRKKNYRGPPVRQKTPTKPRKPPNSRLLS